MEAVFLNILELSLRGSLLILAILPVRALLKKAPRWSICLLWVLAAIALVCPIRFESPTSVLPPNSGLAEIVPAAPALPEVQTTPILIQTLPVENGVHIITPTEPNTLTIATIFWLIGVAVMLCVAVVSYVRLKRRVAVSLLVKNNVYLCDDIDTPFILGIFRPRIYLPSALNTALYSSVLLHEYAHLKRRDHWWKPLGYLLLTVHWFNPLVWLGYGLLCRDIELACDEKVIRDMDAQHKKHYSEALLQCSMPRHLITACPLAFGEVGAKQRIKAVLNYKKPAFWVIVIALVVCVALALTLLTDPHVLTLKELGERSNFTKDNVQISFAVISGNPHITVEQPSDVDALCNTLEAVELQPTRLTQQPSDHVIALCSDKLQYTWYLNFSADCSYLWISSSTHLDNIPFTPGKYTMWMAKGFHVLNPEVLDNLLHSEVFYRVDTPDSSTQVNIPDNATRMEFTFTPTELKTVIENYLNNKNQNIANLKLIGNVFSDMDTYYTVVSMDYTARDGSVLAENLLYLAQIRYMDSYPEGSFRVEGLASGEWGMSAGYYPNVADFGGQTVVWTTRNDRHVNVWDGGVGYDGTVPNKYDTYRITCESGATYDWIAQNATGVYVLPEGEIPTKVAPVDKTGREFSPLAFDMSNIKIVDVRTISEVSGWDVFLEMDAETGEILELHGEPIGDPPARSHEELLTAAASETLHFRKDDPITVTIEDEAEYKGRRFAMVAVQNDVFGRYLVEYSITDEGYQVSAWSAVNGVDANVFTYGYSVSFATFNDTPLCWIHLVPDRTATSADGTEIISSRQANDFTAIRFTMADGKTIDTKLPKDLSKDRLVLQDFDKGTPVSAVPLVGKTEVTILAAAFGELGTYSNITSGFFGHEPLLNALRTHPELTHWDRDSMVLLGQQSYGDYEYAVISHDDTVSLVEYTMEGSTVTLLNYAIGYAPDTSGMRTGYLMNCSSMEGGILYWSLYAPRYKVTPNGKDVDDSLETVTPDFSGFRFTMRDLKTHDFPAEGSFFLCEFTGVIPPAIVTPMEKGKLLAALGSEVSGGLTGTISLKD